MSVARRITPVRPAPLNRVSKYEEICSIDCRWPLKYMYIWRNFIIDFFQNEILCQKLSFYVFDLLYRGQPLPFGLYHNFRYTLYV